MGNLSEVSGTPAYVTLRLGRRTECLEFSKLFSIRVRHVLLLILDEDSHSSTCLLFSGKPSYFQLPMLFFSSTLSITWERSYCVLARAQFLHQMGVELGPSFLTNNRMTLGKYIFYFLCKMRMIMASFWYCYKNDGVI